jgi:lipoate-protein ligase A
MPRGEYDIKRQLSVIQQAAASFGIETDFTGRNDLVVRESGAKFSGNAFRFTNETAMHHGTVLIKVDMNKLARYLAPSPEKLSSKGVESVRARVQNLGDINPAVTVESMKRALLDAFIKTYGPARVGQELSLDYDRLNALREQYASWEWRMGRTPSFDIVLERRFEWGNVEMQLSLREGCIVDARVYSDAMDEAFIERIAPCCFAAPSAPPISPSASTRCVTRRPPISPTGYSKRDSSDILSRGKASTYFTPSPKIYYCRGRGFTGIFHALVTI